MSATTVTGVLVRQAHLIWIVSIVNVALGFFISGFNPFAQSISAVGLQAPPFAYTHRVADIVIGVSMCAFGIGLLLRSRMKAVFSMVAIGLLGASFVSAGIWTMKSPLHLLYNLSIYLVLVPVVCALELKEIIGSRRFEVFCLAASFIHVFMFWCIYAGFIPREFDGLVQRIWTIVVMGWFGVAAHVVWRTLTPRVQANS